MTRSLDEAFRVTSITAVAGGPSTFSGESEISGPTPLRVHVGYDDKVVVSVRQGTE